MQKVLVLAGTVMLVGGAVLPVKGAPAIAQVWQAGNQVAQAVLGKPKVNLQLSADRQISQTDAQGQTQKQWVPVDNRIPAQPGDRLRFTVVSRNEGDRAAKNFAVTQPIPRGTKFVLNSVEASIAANVTYSIDQGKTFTANPVVKVTLPNGQVVEQSAPAEVYTHARWNFSQALQPATKITASYQVAVR
jgi:uncharacterized repeat protein (TIGR01451 family)